MVSTAFVGQGSTITSVKLV